MSTAIEKMLSRRSIRRYKSDMVPDEMLNEIAKAGTFAPTGMGKQSPIIVVVKDKETRDKLSELNAKALGVNTDPFYGAPVVIVVLADRSRSTYLYDGTLVMGNMLLAAHDLGLGSCWIHRAKEVFDGPEGKAFLKDWGVEGDYEGIGHCIVGYFDGQGGLEAAPRKSKYVYYI
jgi:nitroreductase